MKRLLALLIALLLPSLACAQTYSAEWTLDVHEEGFDTFAAQVLSAAQLDSAVNADKVIEAVARILDGFGVRMKWQEDALSLDLLLNRQSLADLQAGYVGDDFIMYSSMMPSGHGLLVRVDDEEILENSAPVIDVKAEAGKILAAALAEFGKLEQTTYWAATGGDAFGAGNLCNEITLDDAALAALLERLMTGESGAALERLIAYFGFEPKTVMDGIRSRIRTVGEKNEYRYVLRLVPDASGMTLTALRGDEQVATLSCGVSEGTTRVVIGTGRESENCWYELVINTAAWAMEKKITGTAKQYLAPRNQSFAWVSAYAEKPVLSQTWTLQQTPAESGSTWQLAVDAATPAELTALGVADVQKLRATVTLPDEPYSVDAEATFYSGDAALLTIRAKMSPAEPLPQPEADLVLADLQSTDRAQRDLTAQVMDTFSRNIAIRLLKLLPLDVIMSIPNMINIPTP